MTWRAAPHYPLSGFLPRRSLVIAPRANKSNSAAPRGYYGASRCDLLWETRAILRQIESSEMWRGYIRHVITYLLEATSARERHPRGGCGAAFQEYDEFYPPFEGRLRNDLIEITGRELVVRKSPEMVASLHWRVTLVLESVCKRLIFYSIDNLSSNININCATYFKLSRNYYLKDTLKNVSPMAVLPDNWTQKCLCILNSCRTKWIE